MCIAGYWLDFSFKSFCFYFPCVKSVFVRFSTVENPEPNLLAAIDDQVNLVYPYCHGYEEIEAAKVVSLTYIMSNASSLFWIDRDNQLVQVDGLDKINVSCGSVICSNHLIYSECRIQPLKQFLLQGSTSWLMSMFYSKQLRLDSRAKTSRSPNETVSIFTVNELTTYLSVLTN